MILSADFVKTGRILGCDLSATAEQWDDALGDPAWPLVDVRRGRMRRDYGLVEILFEKSRSGWRCVNVSLQLHRLSDDHELVVPPGVRRTYGPLEGSLAFSSLASELDARQVRYELIADLDQSQHVRYWFEARGIIVAVRGAAAREPGVVWSVGRAEDAEIWRVAQR